MKRKRKETKSKKFTISNSLFFLSFSSFFDAIYISSPFNLPHNPPLLLTSSYSSIKTTNFPQTPFSTSLLATPNLHRLPSRLHSPSPTPSSCLPQPLPHRASIMLPAASLHLSYYSFTCRTQGRGLLWVTRVE